MFRPRRPFRRRPPLGRRPVPFPGVPPRVAEAERLMRGGQFHEAADRFDHLAREAEERALTEAAGDLYLRAARCYVELNDLDQADERAERAIHLFIQAGRPDRVRQVLPRVLSALERHGRQDDAERLRREVVEAFQGMDLLPGRMPARARMAACLPGRAWPPACRPSVPVAAVPSSQTRLPGPALRLPSVPTAEASSKQNRSALFCGHGPLRSGNSPRVHRPQPVTADRPRL